VIWLNNYDSLMNINFHLPVFILAVPLQSHHIVRLSSNIIAGDTLLLYCKYQVWSAGKWTRERERKRGTDKTLGKEFIYFKLPILWSFTNGIKTALMDVIGLLCVSPGNSTVKLHDNLGSRRTCGCSEAGFSNQNGNRAWGVNCRRPMICSVFVGERTRWKACS
jgi:hypothetical protein